MAIYRGDTKVSGVGKGFRPSNTGNTGDKLEKTATGYQWVDGELVEVTEGHAADYSAMRGPAPEGFHVPLSTEWQAVYDAYTGLGLSGGPNFSTYLKIPMAGNRLFTDLNFYDLGSYGYYWSSSPTGKNAYGITFYSGGVNPKSAATRANGRPVRCFKNSPVVPTSSWTKLYGTSIESGGIFHNATDGLISISSDGTNWITIADKNLGATTVYNYGDTLTEANIGKIYQRGNNYGFSGDPNYDVSQISQSSTQVDVTGYGPGNYYESSTWIKYNPRNSSANNGDNLRGGVTGVIPATYDEAEAGGVELAVKKYVDDMLGNVETLLANI